MIGVCSSCGSTTALHTCDKCIDCCGCSLCITCQTVTRPLRFCQCCYQCILCCACFACAKCRCLAVDATYFCAICGYGTNRLCGCCKTHTKFFAVRIVNLARYKADAQTSQYNANLRLIAAEIEVCGSNIIPKAITKPYTLLSCLQNWNCSVVSDGSLPEGGFEINTHPASGDYWVMQIRDLTQALEEACAWVNGRAGCHIHIDCRDIDFQGLARILRLVANVEAGLYSLIPKHRAHSAQYCLYWSANYLQAIRDIDVYTHPGLENITARKAELLYRNSIFKAIYAFNGKADIQAVSEKKYHDTRYRGVNVHSFVYRRTLEFRMPGGMLDTESITNWGILLATLVEDANNLSHTQLCHMVQDIEPLVVNQKESEFQNLSESLVEKSLTLLKTFAPTPRIRDWIIATAKRSRLQTSAETIRTTHD